MDITVDAILFDIDGTLVDSTELVEVTWRTWAGRRGLDADAIIAVCHGRRTEDTLADFLPAEEVAGASDEIVGMEPDDLVGVTALPATADLLAALPHDRWAAVTSGPRVVMERRLAAAGLPVPEVLVGAEDVTHGKPDPEGYRQAASALGFAVENCLVVEDAPAGIRAGLAAGAHTLAVGTSHDASELSEAHWLVDDLAALDVTVGDKGIVVRTR